jgi:drug/metabolite transporter (DMT)-like permease
MLGETVGLRRWLAVIAGFVGVLFIVRPGASNFNIGSVFVLVTAMTYALSSILTRRLKHEDSSATMSWFGTWVYLGSALIISPLAASVGESANMHPSFAFFVRSWAMPTPWDLAIISALGLIWSVGMYCVAKGYSLALASVAAPFEYTALPINVMWGYVIWHEVPTPMTWLGAALTIASGLYIFYREQLRKAKR